MKTDTGRELMFIGSIVVLFFFIVAAPQIIEEVKLSKYINQMDEILLAKEAFYCDKDNVKIVLSQEELFILQDELINTRYYGRKRLTINEEDTEVITSITFVDEAQKKVTIDVLWLNHETDSHHFINDKYPVILRLGDIHFKLEEELMKYLVTWKLL